MSQENERTHEYAYCGLYCKSCSVYIASQEDPDRLEIIAKKINKSAEETRCSGCRSEKLSSHCSACELKACAISKGIQSCSQCSECPCEKLKIFQEKMPHRAELFESLKFLKDNTAEEWEEKMKKDYSCQRCGKINSPYFIRCITCNELPGNTFIERHIDKIKSYMNIK